MASIVRNPITNKFDLVSQNGTPMATFSTMDAAMARREQVNSADEAGTTTASGVLGVDRASVEKRRARQITV